MSKRPGTWSDDKRAEVGRHHRTTPARGIPEDFERPITGVLEGEELASAREERPYKQRMAHLEVRLDDFQGKVDARLNSIEVGQARIEGQLSVLPELISVVRESAKANSVTLTARVDVDRAEALDKVDARKDKRKLWLAIVGLLSAGAGLGKLLHELGVL